MAMNPEQVLEFWFGPQPENLPPQGAVRWFSVSESFDAEIRERFGTHVESALGGGLHAWGNSPRGNLALILLLDQFTRNIFRGTANAFSGDDNALRLSKAGIARGDEALLSTFERAFLYMPLEHAENLNDQKMCVAKFALLMANASPEQRKPCEEFYDYALQHYAIIQRFGRFPHRNAILGRTSTPEEAAFLQQPGSSF